jgi:hypothetical protein
MFVAVCYLVGAAAVPRWFPVATACVWLMLGGFFLRVAYLLVYFVFVAAVIVVAVLTRNEAPLPGVLVALVVTALLVLLYARNREWIGIHGQFGESMLVDLRDRLLAHSRIPELRIGWQVESVLKPAYGDAFSGDFLVAARSGESESPLELALVDVSGKGHAAGARALTLSGALGGLIGAMPHGGFLHAANRYLLRQGWDEGFATAIHAAINESTGDYEVRSAGHPPAVHFHCGSGRWEIVEDGRGPLLGVLPSASFPVISSWTRRMRLLIVGSVSLSRMIHLIRCEV